MTISLLNRLHESPVKASVSNLAVLGIFGVDPSESTNLPSCAEGYWLSKRNRQDIWKRSEWFLRAVPAPQDGVKGAPI